MSKEKQTTDKIQKRREETEKRIAALKAKDGTKKPLKTGSRLGRYLFPVTVVVLVLVLAVWIAFSMGIPERLAKPITVGEYKVGTVEYNYYYANNMSQFANMGLIPQTSTGHYDLSQKAGFSDKDETWAEVFARMTKETIQETYIRADQAKKAGIELNNENQKMVDDTIAATIKQSGDEVKANNLLVDQYGPGASLDSLREIMERAMLATQFGTEHPKTYDIGKDEVETYYDENTDKFDNVSFRSYIFTLPKPAEDEAELSEEEKTTKSKELKNQAEEFLDAITDENSFVEELPKFLSEEDADSYTDDPDKTLQTIKKGSIADKDMAEWLFETDRETGDKTMLEGSNNNYTVVYFISRQKNEIKLPTVRHILIGVDRDTATEDEKKAALEKAEETLDKIKSAEDMETIGDEMVANGESAESNRYEDVAYGQMVEEFNDWIFDTDRKTGDTDIVETRYGYHVMYFEKFNDNPVWYKEADDALRSEKFDAEMKEWAESDEYKVTEDAGALKYVKQY